MMYVIKYRRLPVPYPMIWKHHLLYLKQMPAQSPATGIYVNYDLSTTVSEADGHGAGAVVVDMSSPVMQGPRFTALLASWERVRGPYFAATSSCVAGSGAYHRRTWARASHSRRRGRSSIRSRRKRTREPGAGLTPETEGFDFMSYLMGLQVGGLTDATVQTGAAGLQRQHEEAHALVVLEAAHQLPDVPMEVGEEQGREVPDRLFRADLPQAPTGESTSDRKRQCDPLAP